MKPGFVRSAAPRGERLICLVYGKEKTGKNHFSFTAPPPIYMQSLDVGNEGVIQKFHKDKEIYVAEYGLEEMHPDDAADPNLVAEAANKVWLQFQADFYQAVEGADKAGGTVVWDTETEVWELIRLARFGVLNPPSGANRGSVWGPVNAEMRRMIRAPYSKDSVNFIMLEKVKDEYKNDKKTGEKQRAGFGDSAFLAQVVAATTRRGDEFGLVVTDCRDNPGMNGIEVPLNDFDMLRSMVLG